MRSMVAAAAGVAAAGVTRHRVEDLQRKGLGVRPSPGVQRLIVEQHHLHGLYAGPALPAGRGGPVGGGMVPPPADKLLGRAAGAVVDVVVDPTATAAGIGDVGDVVADVAAALDRLDLE